MKFVGSFLMNLRGFSQFSYKEQTVRVEGSTCSEQSEVC